jgi:hypothetical protein
MRTHGEEQPEIDYSKETYPTDTHPNTAYRVSLNNESPLKVNELTVQEQLFKLVSGKHKTGTEAYEWKSHVVVFRTETESGYALCYSENVKEAFEFLKDAGANYIHVFELGKTVYSLGL